MLLARLRSLNFMLLAGFALVALPLIFAIGLTTSYVRGLSDRSTAVVLRGIRLTRDAQSLNEQLTAMERNARQYHVVGDPDLLKLYQSRRQRLLKILDELDHASQGKPAGSRALRARIAALSDTLDRQPYDSRTVAQALDGFDSLRARATTLAAAVNRNIDAELDALRERSERVRRTLFWQAASLIPLAFLFAALFTVLIGRPIRQLGRAIRQLGEGDLDRPVTVRGPNDIETLGRRLDWLRRHLGQLEQDKNRFLGHVSHELKTPLANIREASELLLDGSVGPLNDAQREVGQILQSNGLGLQRSIENLLNFTAWQDSRERLQLSDIWLADLLEHGLGLHRLAMERRGIRLDWQVDDVAFSGDRRKLEVMIDNLLSNALKFSPPRGSLHVRGGHRRHLLRIEIADDGPGIPAAERPLVFEAFFQGARRHGGAVRGTGIGLSVVRECVRAHGGELQILDGEFPGAHFRIDLPLLRR